MISLEVRATLQRPASEVFDAVLDPDNWTSFTGHGMIPGIAEAAITPGKAGHVGTVIDVVNTDGSTHRETIIEYDAGRRMVLRMDGFSKPLSGFADHFMETWDVEGGTFVRGMQLVPRNVLGQVMLRLVRPMLRRALAKQTAEMVAPR